MKYGEVKTLNQNYLVFFQKLPICRNFPGVILPGLLFLIASFFHGSFTRPSSFSLGTSPIFHGFIEMRAFLSALTISFNPLAQTGKHFPCKD